MLKKSANDTSSPTEFSPSSSKTVELKLEESWPETMDEFRVLIRNYQQCLVSFAFYRLGNLQDAEDVVQGVFIKAYMERGNKKNVRRVRPYLYRMAANACVDLMRANKSVRVSLENVSDSDLPADRDGVQQLEASAEIKIIEELISSLPDKQAEVIRLLIVDRIGSTDVAEMLGCSVNTVKSRFRYGIEKLRRKVGSQGRLIK